MKHFLLLLPLLFSGCQLTDKESMQVRQAAEYWAEAYFHFDFQQAAQHTTAEGLRWLQFAASNINEADLDVINQYIDDVSISVSDVYVGNDTGQGGIPDTLASPTPPSQRKVPQTAHVLPKRMLPGY